MIQYIKEIGQEKNNIACIDVLLEKK